MTTPTASCSSLWPEFAVSKFHGHSWPADNVAAFAGGAERQGETMFTPQTFPLALLMMITSAICWGSWANTYKGVKNYRFELFYWDYAIGIFLISLILAFTMGSMGDPSTSFLANVRTADRSNIVYALIGGVIFNAANLLLVAGIEMAGLAVAFPVGIGIALVVGVGLSYALQPKGSPLLL